MTCFYTPYLILTHVPFSFSYLLSFFGHFSQEGKHGHLGLLGLKTFGPWRRQYRRLSILEPLPGSWSKPWPSPSPWPLISPPSPFNYFDTYKAGSYIVTNGQLSWFVHFWIHGVHSRGTGQQNFLEHWLVHWCMVGYSWTVHWCIYHLWWSWLSWFRRFSPPFYFFLSPKRPLIQLRSTMTCFHIPYLILSHVPFLLSYPSSSFGDFG